MCPRPLAVPVAHRRSCIETIGTDAPVMPCSVCRKSPAIAELNIPAGPLFINDEILRALEQKEALDDVAQDYWSYIRDAPMELMFGTTVRFKSPGFVDLLSDVKMDYFVVENDGEKRRFGRVMKQDDGVLILEKPPERKRAGEGSHVELCNNELVFHLC